MYCLVQFRLLKNAPDQAVANFRTAIERQPKIWSAIVALANFYMRNKNFDEAEKVIRAGLEQQPDNFAMHMSYAGLLEVKGDYEGAIAEYETLLKQDPGIIDRRQQFGQPPVRSSQRQGQPRAGLFTRGSVAKIAHSLLQRYAWLDRLSAWRLQKCDKFARRGSGGACPIGPWFDIISA